MPVQIALEAGDFDGIALRLQELDNAIVSNGGGGEWVVARPVPVAQLR